MMKGDNAVKKIMAYVLAFVLVLLCACAPEGDGEAAENANVGASQNSISIGVYEFDTYNPLATMSETVMQTSTLVYDSLIRQKEDFSVEPLLCSSYSISDGGKRYVFELREGVRWHDGESFGASDVEYTFDAIRSMENCAYKERLDNVESYMRSGQSQFTVMLKEADAGFINLMDIPIVKKGTDCVNGLKEYVPIGTGMYKYVRSDLSRAIRLVKNEGYSAAAMPKIEEVIIKQLPSKEAVSSALEAREIDVAVFSADDMRTYNPKGSLSEVSYSNNTLTFIGINAEKEGLAAAKVRRALSYAVDREEIVKNVFFGRAESVWVPIMPKSYLHRDIYRMEKDRQRAIGLLDEENYFRSEGGIAENAESGVQLSFELLVNDENALRVQAAEKVKAELAQIGVDVRIEKVGFAEYKRRIQARNYDMFVGEVKIGEGLDLSMFAGANALYSAGSVERFDTLNNRCKYSTEGEAYAQAYGELCETFLDEMPIIPLVMGNDVLVYNSKIKNIAPPYYGSVFAGAAMWEIGEA